MIEAESAVQDRGQGDDYQITSIIIERICAFVYLGHAQELLLCYK